MTQIKKQQQTQIKKKQNKKTRTISVTSILGTKITLFSVFCALSYIIRKRYHIREEEIQYLSLKKQS